MIKKVAFIGAGKIAAAHYNTLRHLDVEVVGVCSRSSQGQAFAEERCIPFFAHTPAELLKSSQPDAVYLLTPPTAFPEILKETQVFDLPTFIEKPLALTTSAANSLKPLLPSVTFVGLNRRFYSNVKKIQPTINEATQLLAVLLIPERTKDYINRPQDQKDHWHMLNGIHCFDLLRYLLGDIAVVHHNKTWGNIPGSSLVRHSASLFETSRGHTVFVGTNFDSPGGWRLNLFLPEKEVTLSPLETTTIKDLSGSKQLDLDPCDLEQKQGFIAQTRCFLSYRKEAPLPEGWVTFDDALASMEMLERLFLKRPFFRFLEPYFATIELLERTFSKGKTSA